jgi:uncharacterized protein YdeI (YjbR/CyaY-like superfamily)
MNPEVDRFISKATQWQEEFEQLRNILLDCGLTEEFKWVKPCYSYQKNNIVIMIGFKNYCALGFFKGGLLNDPEKILVQPGENTNAGRQIRFSSVDEIFRLAPVLKSYIFEAIEVEKAGLKVPEKETSAINIPEELLQKFNEMPELKLAFDSLTPGRQRAYFYYFGEPKQSKTRISRIENNIDRILNKKGLLDCVCGFSHKMPGCDGTHKHFR